jgi:hypothetical protein
MALHHRNLSRCQRCGDGPRSHLARPAEWIAEEAVVWTGYNTAQLRARVQERRFAISGAALLFSGFGLQLVGYAWAFSSWWMLAYAIVVAIVAGFLALQGAKAVTASFHRRADELMRKAVE